MSYPENTSSSFDTSSTRAPGRGVSPWWRAGAIFSVIVLLVAVTSAFSMYEQFKAQMQHMQKQLQTVAQIKTISVLTDDQHAPAMLITHDPQEFTLQMQRLNASDKDLANVDQLAISVENKGGVSPSQGPRLPYLFKGAVVQKTR